MAIYDYEKPEFNFNYLPSANGNASHPASNDRSSKVRNLIEAGNYSAAYDLLQDCSDEESRNTRAVLAMRLHKPDAAIDLLRKQVWEFSDYWLKKDTPLHVQLNLATAFFIKGNVSGCVEILHQLDVPENEQLNELIANYRDWEKSLSLFHRMDWKFCGIEHVCGEIEFHGTLGRFDWEKDGVPPAEAVAMIDPTAGTLGLAS